MKKKVEPIRYEIPTLAGQSDGAKYRKVKSNEPLWVVIDAGNSDVKAIIHGNFGKEIVFAHSVHIPTPVEYGTLARSYENKKSEFRGTSIYERTSKDMPTTGYIVGNHARQSGKGVTIRGAEKYTVKHFGALVDTALLQLYPEGHLDVRLVVLHPAKTSVKNLDALEEAVWGKRSLHVAGGETVIYNVRDLVLLEESVAAFQSFVLNTEGKPYEDSRIKLRPGMDFLMVDIGGWVSYMGYGTVNDQGGLEMNISSSAVIQTGIENVMEAFEAEIKAAFPKVEKIQSIGKKTLYNALMYGTIELSGDQLECEAQVATAMGVLINELSVPYNQRFNMGTEASAIVTSGGGGGVAFDHLNERLYDHKHTFMAERDLHKMRFSAVRGASKGLFSFLTVAEIERG